LERSAIRGILFQPLALSRIALRSIRATLRSIRATGTNPLPVRLQTAPTSDAAGEMPSFQAADLVEKPIVGLGHLKTLRSLQIDRHRQDNGDPKGKVQVRRSRPT
jgi:hypothetical protein